MRPEIVHEQVVRIVNEEVQRVEHLLIVADERHLQILVDHLLELRLGLVFFVYELYLTLLLALLDEEVRVPDDLVRALLNLLNVLHLGQELHVVLLVVLESLLGEELLAHVGTLVELLGAQLYVDEVGFLEYLVHLIHFLALQFIDMRAHLVEEVVDRVPDAVAQVEFLAIRDQNTILNHAVKLLVDTLYEVLSGSLEEQDLVVVVAVVRQVTALLAHELVVDDAEGNVRLVVVDALLHLLLVGGRATSLSGLLLISAAAPLLSSTVRSLISVYLIWVATSVVAPLVGASRVGSGPAMSHMLLVRLMTAEVVEAQLVGEVLVRLLAVLHGPWRATVPITTVVIVYRERSKIISLKLE